MLPPKFHSRAPDCLDASKMNEPNIEWESEIHKVVPNYGQNRGSYKFLLLRKDGKPLFAEYRHYATVKRAKEAAEKDACVQKTTDRFKPEGVGDLIDEDGAL